MNFVTISLTSFEFSELNWFVVPCNHSRYSSSFRSLIIFFSYSKTNFRFPKTEREDGYEDWKGILLQRYSYKFNVLCSHLKLRTKVSSHEHAKKCIPNIPLTGWLSWLHLSSWSGLLFDCSINTLKPSIWTFFLQDMIHSPISKSHQLKRTEIFLSRLKRKRGTNTCILTKTIYPQWIHKGIVNVFSDLRW